MTAPTGTADFICRIRTPGRANRYSRSGRIEKCYYQNSRFPGFSALVLVFLAIFAAQAFGSSTDSSARDAQVEATSFITERLAVWQDRMDLKDWHIRVELVPDRSARTKNTGQYPLG